MAGIILNDIAGIYTGTTLTGTTQISESYGAAIVSEHIVSYFKKDGKIGTQSVFYVFIVGTGFTQNVMFLSAGDRDTFYTSLP